MRRIALRSLAVAGALLLVAAGAAAWLMLTESGLRAAWRLSAPMLPPSLTVGAVDGRLVGPIVLRDVGYRDDAVSAAIARIELDWRPSRLLAGTLDVERLLAADVGVVLSAGTDRAPSPDEEPFRLPERFSLPVDVEIRSAGIDRLEVRPDPDAAPQLVDTIRIALTYRDTALEIRGLDAAGPSLELRGGARIETEGRYATSLTLEWRLVPGEKAPIAGQLSADGGLDALEVRARVDAPYALDAELVVRDALERPAIEGAIRGRIDPAAAGWETPVGDASADVSLAGPIDALAFDARAAVALPDVVDLRIDASGRWLGEALELDALELADAASDAALSLSGRVDLAPEIDIALRGAWRDFAWPTRGTPALTSRRGDIALSGTLVDLVAELSAELGAEGRVDGRVRRAGERFDAALEWSGLVWPQDDARLVSERGRLEAGGTFDAYRFTLDGDVAALDRPAGIAGRVEADGAGGRDGLELERFELSVLDGALSGHGRVAWAPSIEAELELDGSNLDPGVLFPGWQGRVDAEVLAAAAVGDDGFRADIDRLRVTGTLRERRIELDASGAYDGPSSAVIERLDLASGDSRLAARGRIGRDIDVEWDVDSANLADFWPGLAGRLETAGRAHGPIARPVVVATAAGDDIELGDSGVASLRLDASVDATGEAESNLVLELRGARGLGHEIERLDLQGSGNAAAHHLSADVAGNGALISLAVAGAFERPWQPDYEWRFELEEGLVAYGDLGAWRLDGPAAGALGAAGAELSTACWRSGDAAFCVEAARRDEGSSVRFALDQLAFRYFEPYLPEDAIVVGTVGARGRLELPQDGRPRGELVLETSPGRIGSRGTTALPGLRFAAGRADLAFDGERLDVDVALPLEREQGGLEVSGTITTAADAPWSSSVVDARVRIELRDLGFVADLVRGVDSTAGTASMDIGVSGTVDAPRIAGRILLDEGSARLRDPGIELEEVRIELEGDGDGDIRIVGAASSGGGTLAADGRLRLADSQPVGRLDVRGEAFELFDTPDARVWVSPDLRLDLAPDRLQLTGRVEMPQARFTPRGAIEGAVTVSPDQVIVDADEPRRAGFARPFYARVDLTLGDDVWFDGFGLTGRLAGAVEVVEVPQEPVTGSGEVRVESGTYEAYGQTLEVRTGRLLFAGGALARPGLDIEAVRRPAEDILVGARVRGTLERPELSVFSEPPMPRQEQLSYLLLGRPLESTSTSETSALSQAAVALGLRGGNFVSERLNETLGFDEFGIQSQPAEANSASFVIGKYLTPSLYVSYGVGLFEPVNTLRLRYTISSRWRLVTESSSVASGGDLIYHIERGH